MEEKTFCSALLLLTGYVITSLWASPFSHCKIRVLDEVDLPHSPAKVSSSFRYISFR